jgi:hypothetical protein
VLGAAGVEPLEPEGAEEPPVAAKALAARIAERQTVAIRASRNTGVLALNRIVFVAYGVS